MNPRSRNREWKSAAIRATEALNRLSDPNAYTPTPFPPDSECRFATSRFLADEGHVCAHPDGGPLAGGQRCRDELSTRLVEQARAMSPNLPQYRRVES